jgi:hypothetical protein
MLKLQIQATTKAVIGIFMTAVCCSALNYYFLTMPFLPTVGGIRGAFILGTMVFFAAGALFRIWTYSLSSLCIGVAVGIILGGAWADYRISDVSISLFYASWYHISYLWIYDIILFLAAVDSWLLTGLIVSRCKPKAQPTIEKAGISDPKDLKHLITREGAECIFYCQGYIGHGYLKGIVTDSGCFQCSIDPIATTGLAQKSHSLTIIAHWQYFGNYGNRWASCAQGATWWIFFGEDLIQTLISRAQHLSAAPGINNEMYYELYKIFRDYHWGLGFEK